MGYLFLFIALIMGATKGHCSKMTSRYVTTIKNISLMNALRMFLCIIIGFFFVVISSGFSGFSLTLDSFLVCLLSGMSTSLFVVSWVKCVRRSAYTMLSVFLVLTSLVPIIVSRFIWGEELKPLQIVAFCVLLVAVYVMSVYNKKVKKKAGIKDILYLIICGLFNSGIDLAQKWRNYEFKETLSAYTFNFYTYVVSFLVLFAFVFVAIIRHRNEAKRYERDGKHFIEGAFPLKKVIGYVIVLSICLFLNSLFTTLAAESVPSAIQYPLMHGLGLIISMGLGHFFYGEKINKYAIIGVSIAVVSFIIMGISKIV